jgi:hypothetical protein
MGANADFMPASIIILDLNLCSRQLCNDFSEINVEDTGKGYMKR